jgi:hypothetical protein
LARSSAWRSSSSFFFACNMFFLCKLVQHWYTPVIWPNQNNEMNILNFGSQSQVPFQPRSRQPRMKNVCGSMLVPRRMLARSWISKKKLWIFKIAML